MAHPTGVFRRQIWPFLGIAALGGTLRGKNMFPNSNIGAGRRGGPFTGRSERRASASFALTPKAQKPIGQAAPAHGLWQSKPFGDSLIS